MGQLKLIVGRLQSSKLKAMAAKNDHGADVSPLTALSSALVKVGSRRSFICFFMASTASSADIPSGESGFWIAKLQNSLATAIRRAIGLVADLLR